MGKTAFIGSGSMARAIIGGLVRHGVPGGDILVVNPRNPKSTGEVQAMYGAVPSGARGDTRGRHGGHRREAPELPRGRAGIPGTSSPRARWW